MKTRNSFLRKIELYLRLFLLNQWDKEKNILLKIVNGKGADIGCGSRKISHNCIGVDLTGKGEKGQFGYEKNKISVSDYKSSGDNLFMFKDNELDFIVAKHNLKHYAESEQTLKEWKRVLKFGGKIGVIVPDDRYLNSLKLDETHKIAFDSEKLEKLFQKAGFKIIDKGIAVKHWSIYLIAEK
jgi:ubiquinone/menaquinone biosynthesis C-methylase UbiE